MTTAKLKALSLDRDPALDPRVGDSWLDTTRYIARHVDVIKVSDKLVTWCSSYYDHHDGRDHKTYWDTVPAAFSDYAKCWTFTHAFGGSA